MLPADFAPHFSQEIQDKTRIEYKRQGKTNQDKTRQAQLGVPHSEIQVVLSGQIFKLGTQHKFQRIFRGKGGRGKLHNTIECIRLEIQTRVETPHNLITQIYI